MSKLHLTSEQIATLDFETLMDIHDALNDELCILAEVERSLYKRRRQIQIEEDPSLLEDKFNYLERKPKPKKKKPSTQDLINALKSAGITKKTLNQFIK